VPSARPDKIRETSPKRGKGKGESLGTTRSIGPATRPYLVSVVISSCSPSGKPPDQTVDGAILEKEKMQVSIPDVRSFAQIVRPADIRVARKRVSNFEPMTHHTIGTLPAPSFCPVMNLRIVVRRPARILLAGTRTTGLWLRRVLVYQVRASLHISISSNRW
jgi:hypothetical protein